MATLKMPVSLSSLRIPDVLRNPFRPAYMAILGILLMACFLGLVTPLYVAVMDGAPSKLMALPAAMVFGLLLLYDRKLTMLVILLLRAGTERTLMQTSFSLGGIPLGVGGLLNGCVILVALLLVIEYPKHLPRKSYMAWVPFISMLLLGVTMSPSRGDAVRLALTACSYASVFVAGHYFVQNKEDFRRCVRIVLWSSAIPVLYGVYDTAWRFAAFGGEMRLYSTFGHPNILAFYLTVIISLAFYMFKTLPPETKGRTRLFLGCYIIGLLGMLVLTKTRSAWIATALSFVVYALLFERRYLVYMAGLGLVGLLVPGVLDRLTDLGQGNEVGTYANLNSFSWRVYLWQTGLQWMSPSSYVFGNGLQSFREYSPIFFPFADHINWNAHSAYVQIIFELGAVGTLAWAWLYGRVLSSLAPLFRYDRMAAYSLCVVVVNFLICAISDNMLDYLAYNWYLWFIVGAGCGLAARVNAGTAGAPR
jgi:hypothetical protein